MDEYEYCKEELDSLSTPEYLHKLAEQFLSDFFRELPNGPFPSVGIDDEETEIVLTFYDKDMIGNLSIYPRGVYAFYFKRGSDICKGSGIPVGQIHKDFVQFLEAEHSKEIL